MIAEVLKSQSKMIVGSSIMNVLREQLSNYLQNPEDVLGNEENLQNITASIEGNSKFLEDVKAHLNFAKEAYSQESK